MKLNNRFPFMLVVLLALSGCSALSNLDELSVMGAYSREKDSQARLIKSTNERYDALAAAIDQKTIGDYRDKASFEKAFGEPILKKDLGGGTEQWLYRYAIYKTAKDKVYVYFDSDGKMTKWEKLPCPSLF